MRKLLYLLSIALVMLSCQRRELTYNYNPTCEVAFEVDWSNMNSAPTGMSIYCFPESGGSPTVVQTNNISSASANLAAGVYNILIFNQIPSEYGGVEFVGLESFETAEIKAVTTTSKWAVSKAEADLVSDPEDVAAATYLDFEVSAEDVRTTIELKSKTKSDIPPLATLSFVPKVVTKTTRVRIRLSAIYNHLSTRATLYGMSTGYHFANQQSHTEEVTHVLESWDLDTYDYNEGEIWTYFTCFGLPELTTTTRSESAADYSRSSDLDAWTRAYEDWDGQLDIEILLVDNSTIVSETIMLADKIVTSSSSSVGTKDDSDTDVDLDADLDMDINVDINIASGFGEDDDDDPIVLPDVEPVGGSSSGFDAYVDDWGNEEVHDVEI